MPAPSSHARDGRAEQTLLLRVVLALGLALLLVVGAWSTSHGPGDVHATLCLAPGVSATSGGDHHEGDAAVVHAMSPDSGIAVVGALCGMLLVLLLLLRFGRGTRLLMTRQRWAASAPPRAGPRRRVPALTLAQLSLSRT
ncbi:hypothetical protein HWD99_11000 [Microbacterium sp. C5A9]|uniref:hypothetical protein n=1 Tax=Microbacterium sp. C5A9 TaxID=2736663 RepID=UPI001F52A396|nr:hypothetical protein [Microbacterium sp. C5A9]MCI1019155.1 hypothetical protein [Microbacterium sp. C5A9]